jgi:hypothetical protein
MTKKTAPELINPSEEELERGLDAARNLVAHMKRMRASDKSFEIPDGGVTWTVTVAARTNGK